MLKVNSCVHLPVLLHIKLGKIINIEVKQGNGNKISGPVSACDYFKQAAYCVNKRRI